MWFVALLLMLSSAWAQKIDPRLIEPGLQKLQADIVFEQAVSKALKEDIGAQRKKLCDLIEENKRPEECKGDIKP